MRYRILGTLDASTDDGATLDLGGRKQRALLAVLLLHAGRPVSVDRLIDVLWADEPPAKADASLQAYVSNLPKLLEPWRRAREAASVLLTEPAG